jgi:hypothetical protein
MPSHVQSSLTRRETLSPPSRALKRAPKIKAPLRGVRVCAQAHNLGRRQICSAILSYLGAHAPRTVPIAILYTQLQSAISALARYALLTTACGAIRFQDRAAGPSVRAIYIETKETADIRGCGGSTRIICGNPWRLRISAVPSSPILFVLNVAA